MATDYELVSVYVEKVCSIKKGRVTNWRSVGPLQMMDEVQIRS